MICYIRIIGIGPELRLQWRLLRENILKRDGPFAFEKTPDPRISFRPKLVPVQLDREYEVKMAY